MRNGDLKNLSRRAMLVGSMATVPSIALGATTAEHASSHDDDDRTRTAGRSSTVRAVHDDLLATDLQSAVDALPEHGTLLIRRRWRLVRSLVLARPVSLRFDGGALHGASDFDLVSVQSSSVRIIGGSFSGAGGAHSGLGRAVRVAGTVAAPIRSVRLEGLSIDGFSHDGVLLEHCDDFTVIDCSIRSIGYAGVLLFSCSAGVVRNNRIDEVLQPEPYVNSYGIEAVRATTTGLDGAPRSRRILIADNHVRGVRKWEGIDTHGGEAITIVRNVVEECRVGIALVPSKDEADAAVTKYAPIDCAVSDNVVRRTWDGPGAGIVVRGAGETVGSSAERATAVVLRNTVTGYGDGDREAAILLYLTRDVIIGRNHCCDGLRRSISLYHSNDNVSVLDNTVERLRAQGTATSVAIDVRATSNMGLLAGNSYAASGSAAAVYGVMCKQQANDLVLLANDWPGVLQSVVAASGAVHRFRED